MGTSGASVTAGIELPERYTPVRFIAEGGMASVWCVTDELLGRRVAVKVLSHAYAENDRAVRRFKREARAAARLSGHPHVVSIYDVGEAEAGRDGERGQPFIVMEYLAGGTVADAIRVGSVERERALTWIQQAAAALDYAHAHGVVHRDVKPGNLLLDGEQSLHVADFGIARLGTEDTLTELGQVLGTAAYISPEQVRGWSGTDASDRYSLAVLAYELLVGERPFTAQPAAIQARQHLETDPPRASARRRSLPRAVDHVLARGMAKSPEARWGSATAFADELERALWKRRATPMRPAPVTQPPKRPAARNVPGRAVALAGLAAAALGVGIAATASRQGTPPRARPAARIARVAPAAAATHRTVSAHKPPRQHVVSATNAASTTPAPTADTLEARGHQLMLAGDWAAAIPTLRAALAAASTASPTYAYALYDLGRSLRLAGDPRAAVPILWRRLQIPIETAVVRDELQLALQAIGMSEMHAGGGD